MITISVLIAIVGLGGLRLPDHQGECDRPATQRPSEPSRRAGRPHRALPQGVRSVRVSWPKLSATAAASSR